MPSVSTTSASQHEAMEGFEGHYGEVDGYTIGFEQYTEDADLAAMFAGLPDDRCQCPHWGYVLRGKIGFRSAAGEETFVAGDAYYVGPGHTPILHAGGAVVEFSPSDELAQTMEVVMRNMAAAAG
jgi:hypothetical protein